MSMVKLSPEELFDMEHTQSADIFEGCEYPWQALEKIGAYIVNRGKGLSEDEYLHPAEDVWIARDAKVAQSASITGPCIIESGAEIRHCAFIRGNAVVGRNAVVGNSTELKNVLLFDKVQVPHYNYVGDSILGFGAHMGAASLTSNVKSDKRLVSVHTPDGDIETGRKKFGAMIGDGVEIGCGSVLNPGTVIGRASRVYPLSSVRGCVPENSIYKGSGEVVEIV